MAQTETRPGFRLPWTADRTESDRPVEDASAALTATDDPTPAEELVTPDMIDADATAPARRPTKFMADLSRAMQAAAESSRDETMTRFGADAKSVVEGIHATSTVEAAGLRRRADDDVAAVREWSKAEIARIREEAESRIATRKTVLDGEMDAHGAAVEARVQHVAASVAEFETLMAGFFERLMTEEDPTRIATMAETMPDPPDLAELVASIAEPTDKPLDPSPVAPVSWSHVEPAIPDGAETPGAASVATSALPAGPDFAAAEAEAASFSGEIDDDDDDRSGASVDVEPAQAADPIPADASASPARTTTRVIVLGLVSVASIATFKRTLGRAAGISAIGVASGPDGEFVFTVDHDAGLALGETITALPGFEARITAETTGRLEVAAHDSDAGN